jgi:hypothetical protein
MAFRLKSQSPLQQRFPVREKLYPGEDTYFKDHPEVGGMAAEDNSVILNPYSKLNDAQRGSIVKNETARLWMRNSPQSERPSMRLRGSQRKAFDTIANGKPYSQDTQDIRETIIARVVSGDTSAGKTTRKQRKYAQELSKKIEQSESPVKMKKATPKKTNVVKKNK